MSPTNTFADLNPRVPVERAETRRVGPGWDTPVGTAIRDDPVTNFPLTIPIDTPIPPPPAALRPPPPTETELRAALAQCIALKRSCDDELADAETHAESAAAHVEGCRARLAEFASLDATITTATVVALRSGDGRPRGGMDDELRQLVRERDDARADLRAAESAQRVLEADLAFGRADAEKAFTTARKAAVGVLGVEAVQLAERHDALLAEAAELRERLAGFDRVVTNIGPVPALVLSVLRENGVNLNRVIDSDEWSTKLAALLADTAPEGGPVG